MVNKTGRYGAQTSVLWQDFIQQLLNLQLGEQRCQELIKQQTVINSDAFKWVNSQLLHRFSKRSFI